MMQMKLAGITPTLSLCMIVKNEEKNLARCLTSVQGVADELIVVDTGSRDSTIAIAESFGAQIYHHVWQNDFSLARNIGLEKATCEWMMYIDADEELEPETRRLLKPLLQSADAEGIIVTVRNFNPEGALSAYHDSAQVRVFRNRPVYRFEQRVHNQISPAILRAGGRLAEAGQLIWWHYGYLEQSVQGGDDRLRRSRVMLESALREDPQNAYLNAKLGIIYFHLKEYDLAGALCTRVLMELDTHTLGRELTKDVLRIFANNALVQGQYKLAIDAALSCQDISVGDADGQISALDVLSRAYGALGEESLRKVIEMEHYPDWRTGLVQWKEHLVKSQEAINEADQAFDRLLHHPALRPEHQEEIRQNMAHCTDLLAYIRGRFAQETGSRTAS